LTIAAGSLEKDMNDSNAPCALTRVYEAALQRGATPGSLRALNLPAERYHKCLQRYSCSTLKAMLISPAHYMQQLAAEHRPSPAMEFGSLVHLLVLEPWRLPHEYVIVAEPTLTPALRREIQSAHPGLRALTEVQLHEARIAAEKVLQRCVRGRPLHRYLEEGLKEITLFYTDPVTRLRCRVRLDLWHPDVIIDLKTTRHAQIELFSRACVTLSYDMQAYMYSLADLIFEGRSRPRDFVFVAVQSEAPHPVHVLNSGSSFLANGEAKYVRSISLAHACTACDWWPDNGSDGELEIEPWQAFTAANIGRTGAHEQIGEAGKDGA
jgi:hypothetical protein